MTKRRPPRPLEQLLAELYADIAKAGPSPLDAAVVTTAAADAAATIKSSADLFHRGLTNARDLGRPIDAVYFRAVAAVWQRTPLSIAGSRRTHGRYHRRPDPTLYLCERPETTLAEVRMFTLPRITTTFPVVVKLRRVLDLTDPSVAAATGLQAPALLLPWEALDDLFAIEAYSQLVAKMARLSLFEGLLVESAAARGQKNLIVFTDNLREASSLALDPTDPTADALGIAEADRSIIGQLEDS